MEPSNTHRFQFGLRTLLCVIFVAALAVAFYVAYREREVLPGLRIGTSREAVLLRLGEPKTTIGSGNGLESWVYAKPAVVLEHEGMRVLYGGGNQQWTKFYSAQSMTIDFQGGKVIDARLHSGQ